MNRLSWLRAILAASVLLASPALAASDKPLVIIAGQTKQLPATDSLQTSAASTANASINMPHGTAPSAPVNGDCWTTTGGLFCRISGVSVGPFGTGSGSVTSVATGTGLTGGPITTTGTISLDAIADQRVLANVSGGSTAPTATAFSSLTGVGSALKWTTGRTLSITGDLTYTSPSVDGSGNVTAAGTLATVNADVGTWGDATHVPQITLNAKGLATAAASVAITVPTGANPSATVSGSAVNGSAPTFMRSDGAPALASTAVTPGSYTYSSLTVDAQGRLTAASSGTAPAAAANPSGTVGLSAVNGVATTFLRSDGAPALSQAIAPTWTGAHQWTPAASSTPIKVNTVSQTVSTPILDLAQTWNGAGVAFTAIKLNITNTASSSLSPLIDLQIGGSTKFKVDTQGIVTANDSIRTPQNFWANANAGIFYIGSGADAILTRRAAANFQLGAADAASPVAQTLTAQGSRSGTDTNVAGGSLTIQAGRGTGNATGSSLIFQAPVAVASGTGAQTQTTALTLTGASATVAVPLTSGAHTMTVAAALSVASGTNQRAGNATLVGGTITVANTTVTANTVVMLTRKTSGGTIGTAITYTVSAATSFTITSDNILDTSTFSYFLIEVP